MILSLFVLSFASFCTLHQFRRARSALPCYLPLCFPIPLHISSGLPMFVLPWGVRGGGRTCCCGEGVGEAEGEGAGGEGGAPNSNRGQLRVKGRIRDMKGSCLGFQGRMRMGEKHWFGLRNMACGGTSTTGAQRAAGGTSPVRHQRRC